MLGPYTLPDGTVIEVTGSDTYSGPNGRPGCQRTSKTAIWYKLPDGDWQITRHSMHKFIEWISLCENLADFLSLEN